MNAAIEVADLVVRYGQRIAVGGVSFEVSSGDVLALLGPNGAGKTSTIEVCEGFRPPARGQVRVLGRDPWFDHDVVVPQMGVMLQSGGVYPMARAGEMLSLLASFAADPLDVGELAERLGLNARAEYRTMSGGEKQRLHLALALVGRPAVVFLDEPTAGMDVAARHTTWALVDELRNSGVAVLLTTHLLDEAERLADHVVIMRDGQVATAGSPTELTAAAGIERALVHARAGLPVDDLSMQITEVAPGEYEITGIEPDGLDAVLDAVVTWCREHGAVLTDVRTSRPSLEDVFLAVTSRDT